jgi:putative transposase
MSRFRKLSQTIWHCQYHIVFVPKYRFRILIGEVAQEVGNCIRAFVEQQKGEIVELNVQIDHVHLLVYVPPKVSISNFVGVLKGRTAIRIFNKFRTLKNKPYWGNHFWSKGYCVDTVGLDAEMIKKYVKYQEKEEKLQERQGKLF